MHFGLFGCLTKLGAKRAELVQKFVPRSRVGIFPINTPNPPHWALNCCFGAFRTFWVHSGPFGCLTNSVQNGPNKCRSSCHKVASEFFAHTRSTPLDHKLTFWYVLYYLGAFETVWLPYKTRCKTGRTSAKVRATKSRRNFSQRMHPIHPIRQIGRASCRERVCLGV